VPIGEEIKGLMPETGNAGGAKSPDRSKNSLLMIIATDAPLQVLQLTRLARRAALGVGRDGSTGGSMSGEFALAFSTTNTTPLTGDPPPRQPISDLDERRLDPLFEATVQALEEAIVNQLVAAQTMVGVGGYKTYGLPHDRLIQILKSHNRLAPTPP
jgi:L-aminopeptidase/D-esterase-like protein